MRITIKIEEFLNSYCYLL